MFSLTRMFAIGNIRTLQRGYAFKDPGIGRRKEFLESNEEVEETDLDDLESDFMGIHKTHKEHVREMKDMLEKEKFHIVKQKYFKEKYPNFLTWNDKEQIRYLHNTYPEEWSIDRLAEGFPALPEVIMKIVKSKWTKNESKIRNHDLAVQKNWELFKQRKIPNLPMDLSEHLSKFTNRALNLKPFEIIDKKKVVEVDNRKIGTEFSEIITSYEKLKNKNKKEATNEKINVNVNTKLHETPESDTYLTVPRNEIKRKKHLVTLSELQSEIQIKANNETDLSEDDKLLVKSLQEASEKHNELASTKVDITAVSKNKFYTSKSALRKTERDYSHLLYPELITIPKKLLKKGCIYKLNDCYYDVDGEFLYRVPGMD